MSTGQSGGQITEDLLDAGREVHLAVSACPEAPRRYRGQDVFCWILQLNLHGPGVGINGLQADQLPSPAARFMCNPLISGYGGGHSIHLRDLGRRCVRLHGRFEGADDGALVFSDDLPERLALVEAGFGARLGRMADAYIAAAGIDAPPAEPVPADDWLPANSGPRLDPAAEGVTSVIWCTGYAWTSASSTCRCSTSGTTRGTAAASPRSRVSRPWACPGSRSTCRPRCPWWATMRSSWRATSQPGDAAHSSPRYGCTSTFVMTAALLRP